MTQPHKLTQTQQNRLICARCWWCTKYVNNRKKGHCMKYGFTIAFDDPICSGFDRGD